MKVCQVLVGCMIGGVSGATSLNCTELVRLEQQNYKVAEEHVDLEVGKCVVIDKELRVVVGVVADVEITLMGVDQMEAKNGERVRVVQPNQEVQFDKVQLDWKYCVVVPSGKVTRGGIMFQFKKDTHQVVKKIVTNIESIEELNELFDYSTNTITTMIGTLGSLTRLCLPYDQVTGAIPTEIGMLTKLDELDLSNNQLSGTIPSEIGLMTKLSLLNISDNNFTGSLPKEVGNLYHRLQSLDFSYNIVNGTIPSEFGILLNLVELYLNNNMLSGQVPIEIASMRNLVNLSLANNSLTGQPFGDAGTAPRKFSVNDVREDRATITWNPPVLLFGWDSSEDLGYEIQVTNGTSMKHTSGTSITLERLSPNTTYYAKVRAISDSNIGGWSCPISFKTEADCELGFERIFNKEGAYVCTPCGFKYYRGDSDVSCQKCPKSFPETQGTVSMSQLDCLSTRGYYTSNDHEPVFCDATSFAEDVICDAIGVTIESLQLKRGRWRIGNQSLDIRTCDPESYCMVDDENNTHRNYCSRHHEGILCVSCMEGYAIKNEICSKCSDGDISKDRTHAILYGLVGSLVILSPSIWLAYRYRSKSSEGCKKSCTVLVSMTPSNALRDEIIVYARIGLGFLQVWIAFGLTTSFMVVSKSAWVNAVIDLNLGILFNAMEVGCYYAMNYYDILLVYTISPLLCFSMMIIVVELGSRKDASRTTLLKVRGEMIWMMLQICFFIYPGISSTILRAFLYDEMPHFPGDDMPHVALRIDPSIDYNSSDSHRWRIYAGLMFVVYPIGIFALFFGLGYYSKKVLAMETPTEMQKTIGESVSFLYRPYNIVWFESYELNRKFAMTSIFILVYQASETGGQVAFLFMGGFFLWRTKGLKPYRNEMHHMFAEFSLVLICMLGFVSFLHISIEEVTKEVAGWLVIGIGAVNVFACLSIISWHLATQRFPKKDKATEMGEDDTLFEGSRGVNQTGFNRPIHETSFVGEDDQKDLQLT